MMTTPKSEKLSYLSLLCYFTVVYVIDTIGCNILFAVIEFLLGTDTSYSSTMASPLVSGALLARRVRLKTGVYADKVQIRYLACMSFIVPLCLSGLIVIIAQVAIPETFAPLEGKKSTTLALIFGFGSLISFLVHALFFMLGMHGYNKWHKKRMEQKAGQKG